MGKGIQGNPPADDPVSPTIDESPITINHDEVDVFGTIMQQVILKQGIKLWGDKATASAMKEMKQMHDRQHKHDPSPTRQ